MWGVSKKVKKIDEIFTEARIFCSPLANSIKYDIKNFLKGLENGRLKDISNFYFQYFDANNIELLEEQLDSYCDIFIDFDTLEFDQEYYDLYIDRELPGSTVKPSQAYPPRFY